MTPQTYNPLRFRCAPNEGTPDYVVYHDFHRFVGYGLMCCWLSVDVNNCNEGVYFPRPWTQEDVHELRKHFLDLLETVIVSIWNGDYGPGDGEIDGNYQYVYVDDGENSDSVVLTWHPRLDEDSIMLELSVTGCDEECIWLSYDAITDRQNVLQVIREAREATSTGPVWERLEILV